MNSDRGGPETLVLRQAQDEDFYCERQSIIRPHPERVEGQGRRSDATREAVLAAARTWLGTPYQHQASLKGVGCDCLGLVRGVWREAVGAEPEPVPPYRPDWAEVGEDETLLNAARRWLTEIDPAEAQPGDVLLFRMADGAPIKHCAILSAAATPADKHARMIHAYWGRAVVESWVVPWWSGRLAAAFAFPDAP